MRHLKNFNESKTEQEIHQLCKKYKIIKYKINKDGSIDVNDNVSLLDIKLTKLPLVFNKISVNFNCMHNKLTSLEGCLKEISGHFNCMYNKLTSLEGCPKK